MNLYQYADTGRYSLLGPESTGGTDGGGGGFDLSALTSMFGGGGGGGGGAGGYSGGFAYGSGARDPVGKSVLAPTMEQRNRLVELSGEVPGIGSGIQPVAMTAGGRQMAGARAQEMNRGQDLFRQRLLSGLGRKLRQNAALGNTIQQGVGLAKDVALAAAGAGGGGSMGSMGGGSMGGFAGGGAGSGGALELGLNAWDAYNRYRRR